MAGRGGRNDDAIAEALEMIAGVLGGNPNRVGISANRKLGYFQRINPPYGTHMLAEETDDWWIAAKTELEAGGGAISWAVFRREFLRRYFPEDVRGRKEIEFLELKHGNMYVPEYASKFVELAKYYTHYNNDEASEFSKCIKFENGLCDEIKKISSTRGFTGLVIWLIVVGSSRKITSR
ncbi:uncharacterized protein LOC131648857 [Vicia villosa]|uniref:uncharacterized protein LOC131648857 n=1 Tax=Vicia villosa TaxID=3911 RepID=UPI00273BC3B2|nr:uncharacterized protein LOC131648857 [Vicia villosa]